MSVLRELVVEKVGRLGLPAVVPGCCRRTVVLETKTLASSPWPPTPLIPQNAALLPRKQQTPVIRSPLSSATASRDLTELRLVLTATCCPDEHPTVTCARPTALDHASHSWAARKSSWRRRDPHQIELPKKFDTQRYPLIPSRG